MIRHCYRLLSCHLLAKRLDILVLAAGTVPNNETVIIETPVACKQFKYLRNDSVCLIIMWIVFVIE